MSGSLNEIARREGISVEKIKARLSRGSLVILKNPVRDISPVAIGEGVKTKVNANIGASPDKFSIDEELKKAEVAIDAGTDTIMDLTVGPGINELRKAILKHTNVPFGTVPVYQAFSEDKRDMNINSILSVIEKQCKDGVDFMTIHSGITLDIIKHLKGARLIPITSRGGSLIASWMAENNMENPLYEHFDDILEILKEYGVAISLGDAMRPAATCDATDIPQIQELITLGGLNKIAKKKGVQVIIEGPGHVPLDQIEMNVKLQKKICDNAPFYVLGPLVTDIALGYDHISSAIGGAVAAMHGADFLCCVTPSEHLGLPSISDVKTGVIASRIAAHAADMVKLKDTEIDYEMSVARKNLKWKRMFELGIDRDIGKIHADLCGKEECTMCGEYCALKSARKHFE